MGSRGREGRRSRKRVEKESKKSQNSQFWTLFRLFFNPRGREAPGTHFRTFFGLWARRAQMTPVAGEEDRNASSNSRGAVAFGGFSGAACGKQVRQTLNREGAKQAYFSEVVQEPLPLKPGILVKKSVVFVKRNNGFTKTIPWAENPGKIRRRAF